MRPVLLCLWVTAVYFTLLYSILSLGCLDTCLYAFMTCSGLYIFARTLYQFLMIDWVLAANGFIRYLLAA